MPRSSTSPAVVAILYTIFVDFESFGRDCADFLVVGAELVGAVEQWMDVQCRVRWFATEFAETLGKHFLEVVGEVVLCSEKYNAALRDYCMSVSWSLLKLEATYW